MEEDICKSRVCWEMNIQNVGKLLTTQYFKRLTTQIRREKNLKRYFCEEDMKTTNKQLKGCPASLALGKNANQKSQLTLHACSIAIWRQTLAGVGMQRHWNPSMCLNGNVKRCSHFGKTALLSDLAIPKVSPAQEKWKLFCIETHVQMFMAMLFILVRHRKQLKCPSSGDQLNRMWQPRQSDVTG